MLQCEINDRKKIEYQVARLGSVVEQSNDNIVIIDTAGNIEYVNSAFEKITGYTRSDVIGKNPSILQSDAHDDSYYQGIWQTITAGKVWSGNLITKRKDGTCVEEDAVIFPVFDNKGEIINFAAVNRDTTEQKSLERQLMQAQKMEAIGTLSGGIAHDFNNILGVILGYADMAKEDVPPGAKCQKGLEKISIAAHRAKDLVKQILAFSHQADIELIPLQPHVIIKETLKLLRSTLPTTIEICKEIDYYRGVILANPTHLHQIMMNLCTNAYHAMQSNGGVLTVGLNKTDLDAEDFPHFPGLNSGTFVELTVKDTGKGITAALIRKIFDPYFTTKVQGKGTGLGLSIIHGIVKEYGGAITVDSEIGRGTEFHVFLPIAEEECLEQENDNSPLLRGHESILIVDDDTMMLDTIKNIVGRLGYCVTAHTRSIEALCAFSENPNGYDLVLTDQIMPDMTGIELAETMLRIRADIPIIICTGSQQELSEEKMREIGLKELCCKPLTQNEIAKSIRRVLDHNTNNIGAGNRCTGNGNTISSVMTCKQIN